MGVEREEYVVGGIKRRTRKKRQRIKILMSCGKKRNWRKKSIRRGK